MQAFILAFPENDYEEHEKTKHEELEILTRKLIPIMQGGCYSATVAINKFQVQAVECSVIFFIIVDSISPLSILNLFQCGVCRNKFQVIGNHQSSNLST